jgi:alkylhydroperoxidase family enzyme
VTDNRSRPIHHDLVERILHGDGEAPAEWRRAAYDNSGPDNEVRELVGKVATHPTRVVDEDFIAAGRAGLTDDQIWELIICAAVGQSSRQYDAALAALQAATGQES